MSKYGPLRDWLAAQSGRLEVTVSFEQIEALVSGPLPRSAHDHRAWWANDETHVHAVAWLAVGWAVDAVDQRAKRVRFRCHASAWS